VAEQLNKLVDTLSDAPSNQFPPTWRQTLEELGADELLGDALAERIKEVFARNQITTAVAQQEIQQIHKQLAAFETTIDQLRAGFDALNIGAEELAPGAAELGVLIPRDFVHNKLDAFAEELQELNDIFGVFAEVATGSRPGFSIDSVSSSDLSVFLGLKPGIAACIAIAVERVVALYKQLLEIRKLHGELRKQGVSDSNLKGVEDHANSFMDEGIEAMCTHILNDFYKNNDDARRNELSIELRYSMQKIANRIDRGFNIEVRVEPASQADADAATPDDIRYAEIIKSAAPTLQFLKREGDPILSLPEAQDEADTDAKHTEKDEGEKETRRRAGKKK